MVLQSAFQNCVEAIRSMLIYLLTVLNQINSGTPPPPPPPLFTKGGGLENI